ncbi:MAG: hypothetical protein ACI9VR_001444 [Cognaticolwellia sp.]|jgi:hypothetical protein
MLWLMLACSDYNLEPSNQGSGGEEQEGEALPGDLETDPGAINLGTLCEGVQGEQVLSLLSMGPGPVTVSGFASESWQVVDAPELPFTVLAGESVDITVQGGVGQDTLRILSDDFTEPEIEVALVAEPDSPPTLGVVGPKDGQILDIGELLTLSSQTFDAETPAQDLQVTWSSDLDGDLGQAVVDSSGLGELDWNSRGSGAHQLTVQVQDACGHEERLSFGVCQQAGFESETLDLSTWHFEGAANWDSSNSWVELTPATGNAVGSAFQTVPTRGNNVTLSFQFYMGGGSGADGFAVTALDTDRMTDFLASAGGCLGYGGDPTCPNAKTGLPGWSIEVDTYLNAADPTGEDHVAMSFDGDVNNPVVWSALPEMENTGWHAMEITVVAPRVSVTIDGTVYIDQEISGITDFPAYVGFSAATGGLTNQHLIDALTVTEYLCEEE